MIEEIESACRKMVEVENPTSSGDGHPELALNVPFSLQGREGKTALARCEQIGTQQTAADRVKRRCLVVGAIEPAQHPIQFGDLNRCAKPRVYCILVRDT